MLRQLLAWGQDMADTSHSHLFEDRIYVLTPDAAVIELPQGLRRWTLRRAYQPGAPLPGGTR